MDIETPFYAKACLAGAWSVRERVRTEVMRRSAWWSRWCFGSVV